MNLSRKDLLLGYKVRVMADLWLRLNVGLRIQSPQNQGLYDMCVSPLTVVSEKRWDANKINNLLPYTVANAILSVSTFESVQEDKLIWNEGREGFYSVKSGYSVGNKEQGGYVQVDLPKLWKMSVMYFLLSIK
jgi:hypothetical protein